jgi:hypothetical protein
MRQKAVSALPIIKGTTQWEKSTRKAKMVLSRLWPYVRLEESFKQIFKTTHLVYPMDH